jgi:hypothetical protein
MVKNFLDVLARHAVAGDLEKLDLVARKLDDLSKQLAGILSVVDASSRPDLLAQLDAEVLASLKRIEASGAGSAAILPGDPHGNSTTSSGNFTDPAPANATPPKQEKGFLAENITPEMREWARQSRENLTPEILEWAMQNFNREEALAGYREVLETGGLQLRDFIQELEQLAAHGE